VTGRSWARRGAAIAALGALATAAHAAFGQGFSIGQPLPVAAPPSPAAVETMRRLDASKIEDSGRKLEWVWFDVQGGFEQLGTQAFGGGANFLGGLAKTSASGGVVSAALGARLLYFTILLRGRIGVSGIGELYRVGPEVGFHVPLGNLEPHVELGAGYAAVGSLQDEVGGAAADFFSLRGGYARLGGGVDYFVHPVFSIGAALSGELLGLVRPSLTHYEVSVLTSKLPSGRAVSGDLTQTGSGIGGTIAVTAVAALHF